MNHQREAFKGKMGEHMKPGDDGGGSEHKQASGAASESKVIHHGDGTHSIHHADGEKSGPHPSMAHGAMHMAAKHDGGEHGHIMPHAGGGAVTHHATMDGAVEGPHDHQSEDEAYTHLKNNIGEGAGAMSEDGGGMGGEEDSSFE